MQKMVWNVYYENFNSREIQPFNVFDHYSFSEDVKKIYKKYKDDFDTFSKEIKSSLMYYFWSKAEWEVVITSWPPHVTVEEIERLNREIEYEKTKYGRIPYVIDVRPDVRKKVDVYNQLALNWDLFVEYIWKRRKELKEIKNAQLEAESEEVVENITIDDDEMEI